MFAGFDDADEEKNEFELEEEEELYA